MATSATAALLAAGPASSLSFNDYLITAYGSGDDIFDLSTSELGGHGQPTGQSDTLVSDPGSLPAGTVYPRDSATLGGDVAILSPSGQYSQVSSSTLHINTTNTVGNRGIDCAGTRSQCQKGDPSSSDYNTAFIDPGTIGAGGKVNIPTNPSGGDGINFGVDFSDVFTSLTGAESFFSDVLANPGSNNVLDRRSFTASSNGVFNYFQDSQAGVYIVDLVASGDTFSLSSRIWEFELEADDYLIINAGDLLFDISSSTIQADGTTDAGGPTVSPKENILIYSDTSTKDEAVKVSSSVLHGVTIFDYGNPAKLVDISSSQICGQIISGKVKVSTSSISYCALDEGGFRQSSIPPAPIPVPAALPLLASGLGVFATLRVRRRRH